MIFRRLRLAFAFPVQKSRCFQFDVADATLVFSRWKPLLIAVRGSGFVVYPSDCLGKPHQLSLASAGHSARRSSCRPEIVVQQMQRVLSQQAEKQGTSGRWHCTSWHILADSCCNSPSGDPIEIALPNTKPFWQHKFQMDYKKDEITFEYYLRNPFSNRFVGYEKDYPKIPSRLHSLPPCHVYISSRIIRQTF